MIKAINSFVTAMGRAKRHEGTTRERILNAAILQFSKQSYESTGLRDIAADADVDVAYVHRCFGSKERLFAESVRTSVQVERLLADAATDPVSAFTRELFTENSKRSRSQVGLDIVVRSLSSLEAAAILQRSVEDDFISILGGRLGHAGNHRAALVAAFLFGISVLRKVLHVKPLTDKEGGELEDAIRSVLKDIMEGVSANAAIRRKQRIRQ